jgi:hypothetical protein
MAASRYANSSRAIMPTTMCPISFPSHLLAEPDVEPGHHEEQHHHTEVNNIHHTNVALGFLDYTPPFPSLGFLGNQMNTASR